MQREKDENKRQRGRDWSILKKVSKLFQLCYYSWWSSLFCFKGYWVYFFAKRSRQGQLFPPKVFLDIFLAQYSRLNFFSLGTHEIFKRRKNVTFWKIVMKAGSDSLILTDHAKHILKVNFVLGFPHTPRNCSAYNRAGSKWGYYF